MSEIGSLSQLPIGLAIELIGSDKNSAVFLAGREDDNIGRDPLVGFDLDYIAHFQILAQDVGAASFGDQLVALVIGLLVSFLAVVVVYPFFEEGEGQHEGEGSHVGEEEAHFEHVDELAEGYQQVEEVEEVLKLIVEDQGQEGEEGVLAVDDEVGFLYALGEQFAVHIDQSLLGKGSRSAEQ